MSVSRTTFVARKTKIKQCLAFGITKVTNVFGLCLLSLFEMSSLKACRILERSLSLKGTRTFSFAPFSCEHFIFHIY